MVLPITTLDIYGAWSSIININIEKKHYPLVRFIEKKEREKPRHFLYNPKEHTKLPEASNSLVTHTLLYFSTFQNASVPSFYDPTTFMMSPRQTTARGKTLAFNSATQGSGLDCAAYIPALSLGPQETRTPHSGFTDS